MVPAAPAARRLGSARRVSGLDHHRDQERRPAYADALRSQAAARAHRRRGRAGEGVLRRGPGRGEAAAVRLGAHESDPGAAEGGARSPARDAAAVGTASGCRRRPIAAGGTTRGTPSKKAASTRPASGPRRTIAACARWSITRTSSGYWIRFYTLDGFAPGESKGWDQSYNFGSREAAIARWKAAVAAGVNLIATDQYEDFKAAVMKRSEP